MQYIYGDFLMLTPRVWSLIPRNAATFRKEKNVLNGYHYTNLWRNFDELWLLNEYGTIHFLSHILNNCIIGNNQKKMWKKQLDIKCYFEGITEQAPN